MAEYKLVDYIFMHERKLALVFSNPAKVFFYYVFGNVIQICRIHIPGTAMPPIQVYQSLWEMLAHNKSAQLHMVSATFTLAV